MERPRHPFKLVATAALLGAGVFFGLKPQDHMMSAEDYYTRERVLSSYPFTYEAASYLDKVPYFNRHKTTNGGGFYHNDFPWGPYTETFSDQDEAILHGMSHAWYDHMAQTNPAFPEQVMDAVQVAVAEDKPGGYFQHLEWGFGKDRKGIDHTDVTEWYASIASEFMGNVAAMPEALHDIYTPEFRIDEDAKQIQINPVTPGRIENQHGNNQK